MPNERRNLLDWQFIDDDTWFRLVDRAVAHHRNGKTWTDSARGKSLCLMFFNPSLRTRTSMELAGAQLGAHVTTLNAGQGTWGFEWKDGVVMDGDAAEHIQEAVGVMARYYDAIGVRVFASGTDYQADRDETLLKRFVRASTVPTVNLESAFYHPCQALGDAGTLSTHFKGDVRGKKFVLSWAYHPKALPMAVPNSALLMAARMGMHVTVARPEGYGLDPGVMELAQVYAAQQGGSVEESTDQTDACRDADVIYAKAWGGPTIYTDPKGEAERRKALRDWQITPGLMAETNDAAFMHCLPVRRNIVVADSVLDSPNAIHLLQAEYRLHGQKAILEWVWDLL